LRGSAGGAGRTPGPHPLIEENAVPDFTFNVALGRSAELYNRVKTGDPAGSTLIIAALSTAGLETDAVLRDKDTLADVVAGSTNEVPVGNGYARKTLTAADLNVVAPDDANDRMDLDIPDQTWTSVLVASGGWSKLVVCYKPQHDAAGFFRATPL
jgi:hypothetical protein